jgi:hypothetical protein
VVKLAVAICFRSIRLAPGSIPGRCKFIFCRSISFGGCVIVVGYRYSVSYFNAFINILHEYAGHSAKSIKNHNDLYSCFNTSRQQRAKPLNEPQPQLALQDMKREANVTLRVGGTWKFNESSGTSSFSFGEGDPVRCMF